MNNTNLYAWSGNGKIALFDVEQDKAIPVSHSYFNPSNPTIIHIHGWSMNAISKQDFFSYNFDSHSSKTFNALDIWKNPNNNIDRANWNMLNFDWTEFADETLPTSAERKMHSADDLTYKVKTASGVRDVSVPKSSRYNIPMAKLAARAICKFLEQHPGYSKQIRLVGNSLGAQMCILITKEISDLVRSRTFDVKVPNRIELLDPFWSQGSKDYISGKWTGELARSHVNTLKKRHRKIAISRQISSTFATTTLAGDANHDLNKVIALIWQRFHWLNALDEFNKHILVDEHYFESYKYTAPDECEYKTNWWGSGYYQNTGKMAHSASTPSWRIREMMKQTFNGERAFWDQAYFTFSDVGEATSTPDDDEFYLRKLSESKNLF